MGTGQWALLGALLGALWYRWLHCYTGLAFLELLYSEIVARFADIDKMCISVNPDCMEVKRHVQGGDNSRCGCAPKPR